MFFRHTPVFLLCFGLLGACNEVRPIEVGGAGDDDGDGGDGDGGDGGGDDGGAVATTVTLEDVVSAWDAVACGLYACATQTRPTDAICALAGAATGHPFGVIPLAVASVGDGSAVYDELAGAACLTVLQSMTTAADDCFGPAAPSVDDVFGDDFDASCGALLQGQLATGAVCDNDRQCSPGTTCQRDDDVGCARSCRPVLEIADSCVEHPADCQADAFCDGAVCVSRQLTVTGAQCFGHDECASGRCFDFVCAERSVRNGECVAEGDCQFGQFCRPLPPSTGLLGVCQDHSTVGGECGFAVACAGNQVCPGYATVTGGGNKNGVCQSRPADVGEACTPIADGFDRGDTGCFKDLLCQPTTLQCQEAPALNAACSADGRCGFQAFCDDNRLCQPTKARGEPADDAGQCTDDIAFISGGVCADLDGNRCPATP